MNDFAVAVREMDEMDIPQAILVEGATGFEDWDEKTFVKLLDKPYTYGFVAEAPSASGEWKFAGYAIFSVAADEAELLAIATSPEFLRKGVATEIFAEGVSALLDAGARNLFLEVREDNASAVAFYYSLGFEKTGERKNYYRDGEDAVLMSRPL